MSYSWITTLCLADNRHYYLIVCNNGGTFSDLQLRLQGLQLTSSVPRTAHVMNEGWSRNLSYSEQQKDWTLDVHTMCFGDVNIWVIDKD